MHDPAHWAWRNRLEVSELSGENLTIIGYGWIGRLVARLAMALCMQVRPLDPYLASKGWPEDPKSPVADLIEGLTWADAVSINLPRADKPLIGAEELATIRPGAILIHTVRGALWMRRPSPIRCAPAALLQQGWMCSMWNRQPPGTRFSALIRWCCPLISRASPPKAPNAWPPPRSERYLLL